jgi:hypothetical protein
MDINMDMDLDLDMVADNDTILNLSRPGHFFKDLDVGYRISVKIQSNIRHNV